MSSRPDALPWRNAHLAKWGLRVGSLLLLGVAWEALARSSGSLLFAPLTKTLAALVDLITTGAILEPLWISNGALLFGFVLSVAIGVPLGLLMGRAQRVERFTDFYLNVMLVTPMAALIPLFIIALGLGLASRVLVVFVFAFVIMTVNTRAGLKNVDPSLIEMARSFGATEAQLWRRVLLPGAFPAVMSGVRMGLGRSITGMVVVELLLVSVGVGRLMLRYQSSFDADYLFAVILVVLGEAVLLMELAKRVEKRLVPWTEEVSVG